MSRSRLQSLNSNIDHMKCSLSSKNSPRNTVDFEAACSVYIRFRGVNGYLGSEKGIEGKYVIATSESGFERARGGGDLQGLERRRKGVPSAQGRVGDAADLSSDRGASECTYLCGCPGAFGAAAAGSPARGGGDRLLGGAGDGGATDGTLGDVPHGRSTGASRGQRGLP